MRLLFAASSGDGIVAEITVFKRSKIGESRSSGCGKNNSTESRILDSYVLCLLYPGVFFAILMDKQEKRIAGIDCGSYCGSRCGSCVICEKKRSRFSVCDSCINSDGGLFSGLQIMYFR